jgi:acyl carrier protein
MKTPAQVRDEITPFIADILGLELEEVTPTTRFFQDLGGESIEMLELSFRLEQHYGVKMPVQKLTPSLDLDTEASGQFTPEALAGLKRRYPFLDFTRFETDPTKARVVELITVDAIAHFVTMALNEPEAVNTNPDLRPQTGMA